MDDQQGAREAALPPLGIAEAERIIGRLEQVMRQRRVILVGGQAIALWTAYLRDQLGDEATPAQVVSGDLDLLGASQDAQQAAELLDGRVYLPRWEDRTPLNGVAMFFDGDGHERRLDVMRSIYGMSSEDIRETAIEVEIRLDSNRQVPIWVMHPERCMESRAHNSELPNKQTELAWRQLRASILCVRAFSELLLDRRGEVAVRDVLNLNERIFDFALIERCVHLAVDRGIEVFDAVLDDERLPEKFNSVRLQQMREAILESRTTAD